MLLNQALRRAARYFPEQTALLHEGRKSSYREFGARTQSLACALRDRGVGPGRRVALYLLNGPEFLEVCYACFEIGAVIVPLNTRLAADELVFIVNDADCAAFITDDTLRPAAADFRPRLRGIRDFIAIGGGEGFDDYETLLAASSRRSVAEAPPVSEDDVAGLFYTSGTTGLPKGVMLSHRNLWMNAMHTLVLRPAEPDTIFLYAAPMFHLATFPAVINNTLIGGAHAILTRFDIQALLETVARDRVTSTVLVPTMINLLLNHPDFGCYDLSSLKRITYGAAPMPPALLKQAMERLPGVEFSQGYGQTESSPLLTALLHEDHAAALRDARDEHSARRLASCGRPVIGVEVEVVADDGSPIAPGEVGEVVARGPNVMLGYWKRPEETADALRNGWLHTGDLATVDEDGYLYLVDRRKDMIISGGENVYSTEVENVVYQHPAVREAAVIGIPDDKWGEAVHTIVTLKPDAQLDEPALIAFCAARLADYKVPKSVEIRVAELPKSGTGKILKKQLREPYWQGHNRQIN
jgi:long-chain acyl-CoA synthetase